MRRNHLTLAAALVAAGGAVAACGSKSGGDAELGRGYEPPATKTVTEPETKPEMPPPTEPPRMPETAPMPEKPVPPSVEPEVPPAAAPMPAPAPAPAPDEALATAHKEFIDTVTKRIDAVGKQMEDLSAKIVSATEEQKPALQKLSDDLVKKNDAVAADLKALRDATAEKWNEMRVKLEAAVTDLEKSATDALK
jgi:hypothetical protein